MMGQKEEKIIAKIIKSNLPIEWIKYNMFSSNNIYKNIPLLVFRLGVTNQDTKIEKLEKCVSEFVGKNTWKVFKDPLSRNGNYLLTISVVEDIRKECKNSRIIYDEQAYLGEKKYKLCCEWAIQDIPILAKYIDDFFSNNL